MITVTKSAAETIRKIMSEQEFDSSEVFLRCAVKGGGCSGFQYDLDISNQLQENDEVFESNGIKIACDPKSFLYLDGTEIDHKSGLMESGFVFNNPNATGCCGCKQSFCV